LKIFKPFYEPAAELLGPALAGFIFEIKAFPFDKPVEGMVQPEMILETVDPMMQAVKQGGWINVIINNRAGGNALLHSWEW
jgi:hypothetical protein